MIHNSIPLKLNCIGHTFKSLLGLYWNRYVILHFYLHFLVFRLFTFERVVVFFLSLHFSQNQSSFGTDSKGGTQQSMCVAMPQPIEPSSSPHMSITSPLSCLLQTTHLISFSSSDSISSLLLQVIISSERIVSFSNDLLAHSCVLKRTCLSREWSGLQM